MSCYILNSTDPDRYNVRVGWDSGADSFFVYISRPAFTLSGVPNADPGHVVKSRGIEEGDQLSLEELEREVEGYGYMTDEVRNILRADRERPASGQEAVRTRGAA